MMQFYLNYLPALDLVPATWDIEPQSAIGIRLYIAILYEKIYIMSFHFWLKAVEVLNPEI